MKRRSTVTVGLVTVIAVIILPVLLNLATTQLSAWWEDHLWLAWPLAAALGAVVLVAEVRRVRQDPEPADPDQASRAADDLAGLVERQWRAEAAVRALNQPAPIQLDWQVTSRDVAAGYRAVMTTRSISGGVAAALPTAGTLDDLADTWRRLPNRQLVVLGPPGAGKTATAVMLTLDLLVRRQPGEALPVLLTLSGWDPHTQPLEEWITCELRAEYPALNHTARYGTGVSSLVERGLLIPILDGLDEMPPRLRAPALAAISLAVAGGRPVVLTCRVTEYESAVQDSGVVLANALVVELGPVSASAAVDYLRAGGVAEQRWAPVYSRVLAEPSSVLAQAFSTPLMVWLARVVYQPLATDPAELLDSDRYGHAQAVEEHLLDAFLPTVYSPLGRPYRYELAKVRRWLGFIARHLHRHGETDLAWWRLHRAAPRAVVPAMAVLLVLVGGALIATAYATVPSLAQGAGVAVALAVVAFPAGAATVALAAPPRSPVQLRLRRSGRGRKQWPRVAFGLAFTAVVAVALAAVAGLALAAALLLVGALTSSLAAGLGWPDPTDATSPASMYRDDRSAAAACLLGGAAVGALSGLLATTLATGLPSGPLSGVALALAYGACGYVLARSRRTGGPRNGVELAGLGTGVVAGGLLGGALGGAVGGSLDGAALAVGGMVGGLGLGLLGALVFTASGWFALTRAYLAARGAMPWDVLGFLQDALRLGVLRQAGAVYQFRHARLRDRLL